MGNEIEKIDGYIYRDQIITQKKTRWEKEIDYRINLACGKFWSLKHIISYSWN